MNKLDKVLKICISMGLKISVTKCHFGYRELKALGHVVSGLSLGSVQNKVAAVLKKPMPQNQKQMQSFLGFAKISRPLYEVTKKEVSFEMKSEIFKAYKAMVAKLTSAPLLMMPKFDHPFKLYVDASKEGLGSALQEVQIINDITVEGVTCFLSR